MSEVGTIYSHLVIDISPEVCTFCSSSYIYLLNNLSMELRFVVASLAPTSWHIYKQ